MSLLLLMGDSTPSIGSLFANNEAGLALDVENAYRRGWLYQDSAGATVAAAAGDPVGLILDTAKGGLDNLGPELVTNGDFSTSDVSAWGAAGNVTSAVTGGVYSLTADAATTGGRFLEATTSSNAVLITFRARRVSGTSAASYWGIPRTGGFASPNHQVSLDTSGNWATYRYIILREAGATGVRVYLQLPAGNAVWEFDDVSIKAIPGNHAYQTTSGSRPALARTPDGGRRNLLTGTDAMATQSLTVLAVQHTLSFQGTGTVTLSGASTSGPLVGTGAADIVSLTFTPTAGSLTLTVTGTVQLAQLETAAARTAYQKVGLTSDVTESGKRDCWGLLFDGSDDSLQTASVDFSATDKMTVMAGVRKLPMSAEAFGNIVELGPDFGSGSNPGSFAVWKASTVNNYYFGLRGSSASHAGEHVGVITSPVTNVLSVSMDLAQSTMLTELLPRLNSAAVTYSPSGSEGGTGNFRNAAVFIGRRNNASLPFSGLIYTLIVRGATTPTGTIADFEKNLLRLRAGLGPF